MKNGITVALFEKTPWLREIPQKVEVRSKIQPNLGDILEKYPCELGEQTDMGWMSDGYKAYALASEDGSLLRWLGRDIRQWNNRSSIKKIFGCCGHDAEITVGSSLSGDVKFILELSFDNDLDNKFLLETITVYEYSASDGLVNKGYNEQEYTQAAKTLRLKK